MKYIKLFEDTHKNLYYINDYVLLIEDYFHSYERDASECRGKIEDVWYDDREYVWYYNIVLVNGNLEQMVMEHGIERNLTDEEMKQLKIEKETNKYNL